MCFEVVFYFGWFIALCGNNADNFYAMFLVCTEGFSFFFQVVDLLAFKL